MDRMAPRRARILAEFGQMGGTMFNPADDLLALTLERSSFGFTTPATGFTDYAALEAEVRRRNARAPA